VAGREIQLPDRQPHAFFLLKRWPALTRFLDDGRICLSNNAADPACALLPSGAEHGCLPAPIVAASAQPRCCTLIGTAKLNGVRHVGLE
jgi:hypothetical protein